MPSLHRRPAATAALLAALIAVSACSSSGSPQRDGSAAASTTRSPAPTRSIPNAESGTSPDPSPSRVPVLPDPQITPATGSFSKKDKSYLSGRVPQNMDPAAVLQTGQETCQRVARTAAHDRDAAVGAVIAGDLPDAKAAITHLCPDQKPVLAAADAGFPDGTRKKPAAGSYRALTTSTDCTWRASGSGGKVLASGPSTGVKGPYTVKIPAGTRQFTSSGCYAWVPASHLS